MEEKTSKLIFNPGIARHLLHMGCLIIDIKPSRENPDASVFVFKKDETFNNAMDTLAASKVKDEKEAE